MFEVCVVVKFDSMFVIEYVSPPHAKHQNWWWNSSRLANPSDGGGRHWDDTQNVLRIKKWRKEERCPFWLINKRHGAGCLPLWGPKSFDTQMFFHGAGSGKATEGNLPFLGCFCAQLKMAGFCILGPWCHDFGSSLVFKAREYRCIKVVFSRVHDTWPQEQVPKLCLCTYSFNMRAI